MVSNVYLFIFTVVKDAEMTHSHISNQTIFLSKTKLDSLKQKISIYGGTDGLNSKQVVSFSPNKSVWTDSMLLSMIYAARSHRFMWFKPALLVKTSQRIIWGKTEKVCSRLHKSCFLVGSHDLRRSAFILFKLSVKSCIIRNAAHQILFKTSWHIIACKNKSWL